MPAHASRTLATAPSAPPSRACSLRHRPANAGTPAELSASPAFRPVKLRSVYSGLEGGASSRATRASRSRSRGRHLGSCRRSSTGARSSASMTLSAGRSGHRRASTRCAGGCAAGTAAQAWSARPSPDRGRYLYYRCNRPYDPDEERRCASRQVRTEALESAVREAIEDVLANPELAVGMAERLREGAEHAARLTELERELKASTRARTGSSTSIPTAVSPRTPWIGSRTSSQGAEARSSVSGRS